MPSRRPPSRRPPLKACRRCGALVALDVKVCPFCGSTEFTDSWEGMVIILDPERSEIAKELGIDKPGAFAIKVGGRVVKR
ncbi:MAG: DNA-directed RNA polymerase, subunit E'' [Desulfurococcales archaeon]|nr:DNA-directed RNA polymerase, subunit E'' [Desulfurococcales archaeon]